MSNSRLEAKLPVVPAAPHTGEHTANVINPPSAPWMVDQDIGVQSLDRCPVFVSQPSPQVAASDNFFHSRPELANRPMVDNTVCLDAGTWQGDVPCTNSAEIQENSKMLSTVSVISPASVPSLTDTLPCVGSVLSALVPVSDFVSAAGSMGTDELSIDIDSALEEVMAGLKSLELQQLSDHRMSLPVVRLKQMPKHTPDLVIDLPYGSNSPTLSDSGDPDSPTTAAETFAMSNRGTLKKANVRMVSSVSEAFTESSVDSDQLSFGGRRQSASANRLSVSSEPGDFAASTMPSLSLFRHHGHQTSMPSIHPIACDTVLVSEESGDDGVPCGGPAISSPQFGGYRTGDSLHADLSQMTVDLSPGMAPPVGLKPRPPLKMKPPVMKKPPKLDVAGFSH